MSNSQYTLNNRWLVVLTVMLVAIVEVIDMTIVNVSLPNMMGALKANIYQITWILTSYITSSAICMPLTGFLVTRYGQKKLLLLNILGFMVSSALCGLSTELWEIVLFRSLQGAFGASLVPLAQAILYEVFTPAEQGKAMAILGIGIMAGPVFGPVIGGYITELLNWRWVFFINIPICILSLFLSTKYIHETSTSKQKIDWLSIASLALGVGCLQIFFDRGSQEDWFNSNFIIILFVVGISNVSLFLWRGIFLKSNVINFKLLLNRNFSGSCLLLMIYSFAAMGILALQPILCEKYLNYSAQLTGIVMIPIGLASAVGMVIIARYIDKYNPSYIVAIGILISAIGIWLLSQFNLSVTTHHLMLASAIQGFGMGLFFIPLTTIAFKTLPAETIAEASGIFTFCRNIGSSIGISILSTVLSRKMQINWNRLSGYINSYNPHLKYWLTYQHKNLFDKLILFQLANEVQNQAAMLSFINVFWLTAFLLLMALPLIYFLHFTK